MLRLRAVLLIVRVAGTAAVVGAMMGYLLARVLDHTVTPARVAAYGAVFAVLWVVAFAITTIRYLREDRRLRRTEPPAPERAVARDRR
jgi:membrane protein YqaA with SNARE-associated domain